MSAYLDHQTAVRRSWLKALVWLLVKNTALIIAIAANYWNGLVAAKSADYTKYLREIKKILGFQLLILDDFLLNTIMDEREVKVLMEILEKRIEASKSTIVCSQREPGSWKAMIMNDEVSANAIMKRATKALHCCHSAYRKTLIRVAVVLRRVAAGKRTSGRCSAQIANGSGCSIRLRR